MTTIALYLGGFAVIFFATYGVLSFAHAVRTYRAYRMDRELAAALARLDYAAHPYREETNG